MERTDSNAHSTLRGKIKEKLRGTGKREDQLGLETAWSEADMLGQTFCFSIEDWPREGGDFELVLSELDQGLGAGPGERGGDTRIASFFGSIAKDPGGEEFNQIQLRDQPEGVQGTGSDVKFHVALFQNNGSGAGTSVLSLLRVYWDVPLPQAATHQELGAPEISLMVEGQRQPGPYPHCPWILPRKTTTFPQMPPEGDGYFHIPKYRVNSHLRAPMIELVAGATRRTVERLRSRSVQEGLFEEAKRRARDDWGVDWTWVKDFQFQHNPDPRMYIKDLSNPKSVSETVGHKSHNRGSSSDIGFYYWVGRKGEKKVQLSNHFFSRSRFLGSNNTLNIWKIGNQGKQRWSKAKKRVMSGGQFKEEACSHIDYEIVIDLFSHKGRRQEWFACWDLEANWIFVDELLKASELEIDTLYLDPAWCALMEDKAKRQFSSASGEPSRLDRALEVIKLFKWHEHHFHVDKKKW